MGRQVSDDVVRSSDTAEEVHGETSDISNKFKFFESYKEPEKQRKQFRITPPRDGQVKVGNFFRVYRFKDCTVSLPFINTHVVGTYVCKIYPDS